MLATLCADGELNLGAKGIWSREQEVDFGKLHRRLSAFGLFGL
jgi:hypothetical protein